MNLNSTYRNWEGPYTKDDFEVLVELPHPKVTSFLTYRHCNLPLMGIGPRGPENLFMSFDQYFDLSVLDDIRKEVEIGTERQHIFFNKIVSNGVMPTELNRQKSIDSYIHHIDKYAPDSSWRDTILQFHRKGDIKIFFHEYFGITTPWHGIAQFRNYSGSYENKTNPSDWLPLIEHFPALKRFVESLPFEYVGYVMIFKSTGQGPVLTHRDYYPTNHTVNFMNFALEASPRPFFLQDCLSYEKTYLEPGTRSYFFNEIDAHGVDSETDQRMTLRVEGRFLESFRDQIGLGNSDTFNWDFEHCQRFLKSGQFRIEASTDI